MEASGPVQACLAQVQVRLLGGAVSSGTDQLYELVDPGKGGRMDMSACVNSEELVGHQARPGPHRVPSSWLSTRERIVTSDMVAGMSAAADQDGGVRTRLKRIQYRPELIDAFLAHTRLELDPPPP